MLNRRGFLTGVAAAVAAPYVVSAGGIYVPPRRQLIRPELQVFRVLGVPTGQYFDAVIEGVPCLVTGLERSPDGRIPIHV